MSSIRDFVPLEKLGEGTYSNVYKVKRLTDQEIYALKKVKMDSLTLK
jgi:NIMA (never in mitosis gene a)-related kinase